MDHKIILLLTGTINTYNKEFTLLTSSEKRREDYINAIHYYLKNFNYPIVFVENSKQDISPDFITEIENKQLEILFFDGNDYPKEMGKGYGEMCCIEYAINNSSMIKPDSFIFKITGRYKILNLNKFIDFYNDHPGTDLIADLTNNFKLSQSAIFGFRPFFPPNYLFKYLKILNDTNGIYFEHVLSKAVLNAISDGVDFKIFKYYPKIKAISGTTGKAYKNSFIYLLPRKLKYLVRYFIVLR